MKLADKAGDMKDRVTDSGRKTVDNSTIPAKQLQSLSTPQPQLSYRREYGRPLSRQQNTRHRQLRFVRPT
jgi:hypothetical protein